MRLPIFLMLLSVATAAFSGDTRWDKSSVVKADVDCDGIPDIAKIGYSDNHVILAVTLGSSKVTQYLEFGLGDSMSQDSLCGIDATLSVEDTDYDLTEEFGENPEGFVRSKSCKGLNVSGGECDSMHVYWNHLSKSIDWWRL